MHYEKEFLTDFEAWVNSQVMVNEMAMKTSQDVFETKGDASAREAYLRYEAKRDAYNFLLGKFDNYRAGKGFHEVPDGLFGKREY